MTRSVKRCILMAVLLILLVLALIYGIICSSKTDAPPPQTTLDAYSETVFNPLRNDDYLADAKLSMQENGLDYTNYWVMAGTAINVLLNEGPTDDVRNIVQCLADTFDRYGYFPRPAYQQFEYGWVSSMDAPVIAVLAQMMYEKTGETQYQEFVQRLSDYMLTDVSQHGYVAKIKGNKWLFEYADANTTLKTGEFVLNGSLLGTLGTAMIASTTGNAKLWALVESQTALYEKMMPQYWYEDGSWCYYMLNPKRVNPPHYVLFEIRLFQALAEVTGKDFYQQEGQRRIDLLKDYYKLYVYEENGDRCYSFLRSGAPHYYYTDIYNTELIFLDEQGRELARDRAEGREAGDAWMHGSYPEGTTRVEWHVVPNVSWSVDMGDLSIEYLTPEQQNCPAPLPCSYSASADGSMAGTTLTIRPDLSEETRCNLMGKLSSAGRASPNQIYALELENLSEETFSTNIVLYDTARNVISRYLVTLIPGKNLLVFALPGFAEQGLTPLKNLASFNLRIYTMDMETEQAEIHVGNLYPFDNPVQFWTQHTTGEYKINWGE